MRCILHELHINNQKHAPTILFKNLKPETKTEVYWNWLTLRLVQIETF